jgi:hypothetical protein
MIHFYCCYQHMKTLTVVNQSTSTNENIFYNKQTNKSLVSHILYHQAINNFIMNL